MGRTVPSGGCTPDLWGERDREGLEASEGEAGAPLRRVVEQLDPREAVEQTGEGALPLDAGQPGTEAVVDAPGEAEGGVVAATDVEAVGGVEAGGVAVGGAEQGARGGGR